MDAGDASQESLEVVAIDQGDPEAHQGGQDRDLETAKEEFRREQAGHEARKVGRKGGPAEGRHGPETFPNTAAPLSFRENVRRRHPHRQRPAAQPQGLHRRATAPGAHRHYRSVRVREELARLRHRLRRGAASLHRVPVHVRQAVPRPDAQAPGGPARGARALGGHRAAESRRSRAGPPSARPPRSTTTSGCCGRARVAASAASAGRRCGGTPRNPPPTIFSPAAPAGSRSASRCRRSPGSPTTRSSRISARWASCASRPTARRIASTSSRPASTSPPAGSCWWWSTA